MCRLTGWRAIRGVGLLADVIHVHTIQYVKLPAKIGTPGSAEMLATARMPSTTGKPVTAGRTASNSMFETNSKNAYNTICYFRNVSNSTETSNRKPPGT
jgi:hypothetical protein